MGENHWMKKVVFFKDIKKFSEALEYFDIDSFEGRQIPLKLHMGEKKNKYFLKPDFVKQIIDELKKRKIEPYLFDTTVAYPGLRNSKTGYKKLAEIHGFSKLGCDIIIDDTGIKTEIEEHVYEVATHIAESTHIFALSHVKGHIATGMGGAIKNFGMGGVTKETKRKMHHGSRPIFNQEKCTYCGECSEVCFFNAISVNGNNWDLDMDSCFGCGVCVNNCNYDALKHKDLDFQKTLVYAAKACVQNKNVLYFNDVNRIAKSCDCHPYAGPIIAPDIGYLLSDDPVAIDKASLDLIYEQKKDVFEKENKISPFKQIKYGEEVGLGSSSYKLIKF